MNMGDKERQTRKQTRNCGEHTEVAGAREVKGMTGMTGIKEVTCDECFKYVMNH